MASIGVIGAGLGGLAAAARLAHAGHEVTLYERTAQLGGKAGELHMEDFRFDTGPSLMTMPFVVTDLLEDLGEDPADHLTLTPLDPLCRYFYPDGTVFDAPADPTRLARAVRDAGLGTPERVRQYLRHCARAYDMAAEFFLFRPIEGFGSFFRGLGPLDGLRALTRLGHLDGLRSMHRANAGFFDDPRMVQLLDRYATYVGSSPYRTPATFNLIQHIEYVGGGYLIEGGVYRLVEVLAEQLERLGVETRLDAEVQTLLLHGGRVTGAIVDGQRCHHDAIVSNADVRHTYDTLLEGIESKAARRYRRLEPSSSALVFYWGIEDEHPDVDVHNIFFSDDYPAEFRALFEEGRCPDEPTAYVYVSSKFAPGDAPTGHENWFVMINAPYDRGQDWDAEVSRVRERVAARVRASLGWDPREAVVCERVLTPPAIAERTGSHGGALYGIASHRMDAAFLRQSNRSREFPGLFFCGGSAHPGGGIPLALLSGKMAAELARDFVAG
ncbi:MAG: phytoene desaturase [Armatimonadia bacterium]|nr:phytoene desaturase [Armatimonadia bacterium]